MCLFQVINKFQETVTEKENPYHEGELMLFQNMCIAKQGNLDKAISHLESRKVKIIYSFLSSCSSSSFFLSRFVQLCICTVCFFSSVIFSPFLFCIVQAEIVDKLSFHIKTAELMVLSGRLSI